MSRSRSLALAAATVVALLLIPATAWANTRTCPPIYVHEGFTAAHDPNTLAAVTAAYSVGSNAEIDVQPDRDGAVVLMHPPTLNLTTDGSGDVWKRSTAYIRRLRTHHGERVGFWHGYLLGLHQHPSRRGLVELKSSPGWNRAVLKRRFLDPLAAHHLLRRVVLYSRDETLLADISRLRPGVETGEKGRWWLWPATRVHQYADSIVTAHEYPRKQVQKLHSLGGRVYLHGNNTASWRADLLKGADGVMTQHLPKLLKWCQ